MATGKQIRLKRVIDPAGVSIICALDHGMTSPTFLSPLADIGRRVEETISGGSNVIMMSKGMIRRCVGAFSRETSLALLLSASANPEEGKGGASSVVQVARVEEALSLGADAVVLFVALAGEYERDMIETTARIAGECDRLGMPFIAEAEFPTTYARVEDLAETYGVDYLLRNVRLCAELGADIVKTNWPGNQDAFARLVDATSGVPVVLAGGSRITDEELLSRMEQAVAMGAIGCSVGRNIFMHDDPRAITHALSRVIRERWPADKAYEELQSSLRDGDA